MPALKVFHFVGVLVARPADPQLGFMSVELGPTKGEIGLDAKLTMIEVSSTDMLRRMHDRNELQGPRIQLRISGRLFVNFPVSSVTAKLDGTALAHRTDTVEVSGPAGLTVRVDGVTPV